MRNVMLLVIARFVTMIGSPLVGLLVVRYLGSETYGHYASAIAVTGLFGFLADFGIQQTILRFGSGKEHLGPVLSLGGLVGLAYTGITVGVIAAWVHLFQYDVLVKSLIAIQCIGFVRTPLLSVVTAGLQLQGRYERIAFWNLTATTIHWLGTIFAMSRGWDVLSLSAVPIGASFFVVLVMVVVEGRRLGVYKYGISGPGRRRFMIESWKFGTAGTMHQIYHRADAAILSALRQPVEVGYYSVGMRMADLPNVFPGIVFNEVLFPKYFLWSKTNRELLATYYGFMTKGMIVLGLNLTVILTLFGTEVVKFLFKMEESVFGIIVPIIAGSIVLHFWAASPGAILTTDDHVVSKIRIQAIVAGVSLALNLLFVPLHGVIAASAVFTGSKLLLALLYTREVNRRINFKVFTNWKQAFLFITLGVAVGGISLFALKMSMTVKLCLAATICLFSVAIVWRVSLTRSERLEVLRLVDLERFRRKSSPTFV